MLFIDGLPARTLESQVVFQLLSMGEHLPQTAPSRFL